MTRSQTAPVRASENPQQTPLQSSRAEYCILDCRDMQNNRRRAKKKGTLCSVCEKRIERQAKHNAAWRALRRSLYHSWLGGLEQIPHRRG